jgi:hypothetical protein
MSKLVLALALSLSAAASFACPDGAKVQDAKAQAPQKLAISEQPAWQSTRAEAPKAKATKTAVKPTVATVAETKKPGV